MLGSFPGDAVARRTLKICDLLDNFLENNEIIRLPMLTVHFSSRWCLGLQYTEDKIPKEVIDSLMRDTVKAMRRFCLDSRP